MYDQSTGGIKIGSRVRFDPPGFRRDERTGRVFEIHTDGLHGTTFYVEADDGTKFQLGEASIIRTLRTDTDQGGEP